VAFVAALGLWAPRAQAEAEPPVAWSVGAGCALAFGALAVGGGLAASSDADRTRRTGIEILAGGLVLAPVVSHALAGEWKRAALFGGVSAAMAGVAIAVMEGSEDMLNFGTAANRLPFGAALAVELLVSTAGVVDSLAAGERARTRGQVALLPLLGANTLGLSVAGAL
jgi:hypothetical protein